MLQSKEVPYLLFYNKHNCSHTENRIMDFRRLPKGWHYGQGGPIDIDVCRWALQLNAHAANIGFPTTEAFAGVDGEILVEVYYRRHAFSFTINPGGNTNYRHEIGDADIEFRENLTLDAAKQILTIYGIVIWNLSGLSTPTTLATRQANSLTSRSNQAVLAGEYPSSTESVPWQKVNHSVAT